MHYAILCYHSEEVVTAWSKEQNDEVMGRLEKVRQRIAKEGKLGPVARLLPTTAATTLRKDRDPPLILDGPFAETKEQFLGFYIVDVADLDRGKEAELVIAPDRLGAHVEAAGGGIGVDAHQRRALSRRGLRFGDDDRDGLPVVEDAVGPLRGHRAAVALARRDARVVVDHRDDTGQRQRGGIVDRGHATGACRRADDRGIGGAGGRLFVGVGGRAGDLQRPFDARQGGAQHLLLRACQNARPLAGIDRLFGHAAPRVTVPADMGRGVRPRQFSRAILPAACRR